MGDISLMERVQIPPHPPQTHLIPKEYLVGVICDSGEASNLVFAKNNYIWKYRI